MPINFVSSQITKRINQNKNYLGVICGETGSGKSYCALRIGEATDPNFSIDNVVFTATEFMKALDRAKKGSVIIFDESGVGIPARDWRTISNKALGYVLQTFRHLNLAVIFTTPTFAFLDIQCRYLFHAYMETRTIDYERRMVVVKYLKLQLNPRSSKIYSKYAVVSRPDGGRIKVNPVLIEKPSKKLCEDYEKKKTEYSSQLRTELEDILKRISGKSVAPGKSIKSIAPGLKEQGLSYKQIAEKLNSTPDYIRHVLSDSRR